MMFRWQGLWIKHSEYPGAYQRKKKRGSYLREEHEQGTEAWNYKALNHIWGNKRKMHD